MISLEHKPPPESYEKAGTYTHRLELNALGKHAGEAELVYRNDPFPFYYLFFLRIDNEQRGKGFGNALVQQLNQFLESRCKTGILKNIIDLQNPTFSIYEKNGWKQIEGNENWLIYNPPKILTSDRINKAIHGILEMESDGSFYHG